MILSYPLPVCELRQREAVIIWFVLYMIRNPLKIKRLPPVFIYYAREIVLDHMSQIRIHLMEHYCLRNESIIVLK